VPQVYIYIYILIHSRTQRSIHLIHIKKTFAQFIQAQLIQCQHHLFFFFIYNCTRTHLTLFIVHLSLKKEKKNIIFYYLLREENKKKIKTKKNIKEKKTISRQLPLFLFSFSESFHSFPSLFQSLVKSLKIKTSQAQYTKSAQMLHLYSNFTLWLILPFNNQCQTNGPKPAKPKSISFF